MFSTTCVHTKYLDVLFGKSGVQIYPQTPIKPKYGAFYLNNKVRVHGIVNRLGVARAVL